MKRLLVTLLIVACLSATARAEAPTSPAAEPSTVPDIVAGLKSAIEKHLGRPYVWGATGLKSYDCSGFIWRVLYENGILMKRTTARKFYLMMKPATKEEQGTFGTLVFFDDLKHVGIMDSPQAFYHAQVTKGTNRSAMNSFWKAKVYGYRRLPIGEK
ncbi:MAG TPA: NlpC/P60 family protein [Terriglobia bacterium]|nr:NlpC/P60 family protein [Terriglobia bacterium]